MRRLTAAVAVLAFSFLVPAALADGPPSYLVQGGYGVLSHDGKNRYVAVTAGYGHTVVERLRRGSVQMWTTLSGSWGIPTISFTREGGEGLSHAGTKLIVGSYGYGVPARFAVIRTRDMRVMERVTVDGNFSYDALSPDASKLYLIQHVDQRDLNRYVVRAYDLRRRELLPGRIADRTQKDWVMEGQPVTRTTSGDGRWVYTLYSNPGGYPFVHALDTVRGVAHCTGIPFTGNQTALFHVRLALADGGGTLTLDRRGGRPWLKLDTVRWQIMRVQPHAGLPWTWLFVAAAGGLAVLLTLAFAARVSRRAALASAM
jgi:hypothetical protein